MASAFTGGCRYRFRRFRRAVGGSSGEDGTNPIKLYATSARDADRYRRQTVWVDGPVEGGSGTGAGVALYGGGRVIIGPNGRVGAASGTAILAAIRPGKEDDDEPRLYVELRPGGRRARRISRRPTPAAADGPGFRIASTPAPLRYADPPMRSVRSAAARRTALP